MTYRLFSSLMLLLCLRAHGQSMLEDVSRQFFPESYTTIVAGDAAYAVIEHEATAPISRGTAIILTESQLRGLTFAAGTQLADRLNKLGWRTLVTPVTLATASESAQPAQASENVDIKPYSDSLHNWLDPIRTRQSLLQLTRALAIKTEEQPGFTIIICQGLTAAQLLSLTADDGFTAPDAMVVLAPFWPKRDENLRVPTNIAATEYPVLDIGLPQYNFWADATRAARAAKAETELKLHYRQRNIDVLQLTASSLDDTVPFVRHLSGEIYGWLTYLGW